MNMSGKKGSRWAEIKESCVVVWHNDITSVNGINRSQWQAERDRISGKPSWDEAPEWALWLSQSIKGDWFFHEHKPSEYDYTFGTIEQVYSGSGEVLRDWRDTLEQRPVDSTTNKCDDTESSEDNDMKQVTLRPGDYCDVRGTTPEQRKAIADAFVSAGAIDSDYGRKLTVADTLIVGDLEDGQICGCSLHNVNDKSNRLLTVDQVLNAANAGVVVGESVAEWDGTGLPAAGETCEAQVIPVSANHWQKASVIAYSGMYAWIKYANQGSPITTNVNNVKFRPIRIEEERAVEEMMSCNPDIHLQNEVDTQHAVCVALYRAGYHK